jgi:cell division cycle 20-like protein 1 (cofactor of APC complex)
MVIKLFRSPRKATRKISKLPFKVLDAPELADDFYLNLVRTNIRINTLRYLGSSYRLFLKYLNKEHTIAGKAY